MTKSRILSSALVVAAVLLLPSIARAQSAFAGVVKDATGAVLPGVTVEAASPALIEQVRSVTTDANGAYRIENLRPGTYTLTFSLPGFATVKKEAVELQSNFTATINADLKVGAVEETVTVAGESPVVDVQSNAKAQVLSRDVLDALAAAYASAGRFDDAVATVERGINLATAGGLDAAAAELRQRLILYQRRQPYRQSNFL